MDNIVFENMETIHPEIAVIEILMVDTKEDGIVYAAQIGLIMDIDAKKMLYLPTEIMEDTAHLALAKVLGVCAKMFIDIAARVPVIDVHKGEILEVLNINDLAHKSDMDDVVPEGTTFH